MAVAVYAVVEARGVRPGFDGVSGSCDERPESGGKYIR